MPAPPPTGAHFGTPLEFPLDIVPPGLGSWGWGAGSGGGGGSAPGGGFFMESPQAPGVASEPDWVARRRKKGLMVGGPNERTPLPSYARGGTHPGGLAMVGEDGPEVVNLPQGSTVTPNPMTVLRMLLELLPQLLGGDAGDSGDGGDMPSYAFGTPAQPTQPFGAPPTPDLWGQPQLGTIPAYAYGTPNRSLFGQSFGMPQGQGGGMPTMPGQVPAGRPGDLSGGTGTAGGGPAWLNDIINASTRAGGFDFLGSQPFSDMARAEVQSHAGARERAARLNADLASGGDPSLAAYFGGQALRDTQSEASQAGLNAGLESSRRNQALLNALIQMFGGAVTRRDPRDQSGVTLGLPGGMGSIGIG